MYDRRYNVLVVPHLIRKQNRRSEPKNAPWCSLYKNASRIPVLGSQHIGRKISNFRSHYLMTFPFYKNKNYKKFICNDSLMTYAHYYFVLLMVFISILIYHYSLANSQAVPGSFYLKAYLLRVIKYK